MRRLDWMMARLDGLALCHRISEQETSDPPFIILLTARSETGDIVAALEADTDEAKQTRVQETLRAADKQMADAVKAKRDTLKREDE